MSKITKAVIACGGWSTRFLPTVKTYAKQLLPIVDRPQIYHVLETLIAAGITEVAIVHRHGEGSLRTHFAFDPELEKVLKDTNKQDRLDSYHFIKNNLKTLKFILQPRHLPYGNGTPILAAKSFIGTDPFVYWFGDDLTIEDQPGKYLSSMISDFIKYRASAIIASQQCPPEAITKLSSIKYKKTSVPYQIESVIEKPVLGTAPSNIASVSPFILSPKIINTLQNTATARGELWLTDALNNLAKTDIVIGLTVTHGHWATTGDPLNWLKVNFELALKNPDFRQPLLDLIKSNT